MEYIRATFPNLTPEQYDRFELMMRLYPEWNAKINVISRQDIDNLEVHHILHSMLIGKFIQFCAGTRVLDLGTGGGFPALPLAVMFPQTHFHLVDRVGKKLRVADDIARQIGLDNVTIQHGDIREVKPSFDFIVSRAVMTLAEMIPLVQRLVDRQQRNSIANGLITLKGGKLDGELAATRRQSLVENLSQYCDHPYFETKKLVYISL